MPRNKKPQWPIEHKKLIIKTLQEHVFSCYQFLCSYLTQHLTAALETVDSHETHMNAVFQLKPKSVQRMEVMASKVWTDILGGTVLLQSKDGHPVQQSPFLCDLHHGLKNEMEPENMCPMLQTSNVYIKF